MINVNKLRSTLDRHSAPATAAVLAAAAILLVAHALWRPPQDAGPDGETYLRLGARAAEAGLWECGNFDRAYWSPGWVSTIGIIHRLFGPRPIAVRLALIAAALATAWLTWVMASRLAGRCAAVVAAGLFLFSTLVFRFTAYYQYEIPLALLTAGAGCLLFFTPSKKLRTVAIFATMGGATLGIAALYSPRVLALFPVIATGVLVRGGGRRIVAALAALLAGIALVLLPWTLRNHRCFDRWIVTTTNGGINLYIGNNPSSTGGYYLPPEGERPSYAFQESGRWIREAVGYAAGHPGQTLARTGVKALKFWNPHHGDQFLVLVLFLLGWVRLARAGRIWDTRLIWVVGVPIVITLVHAVFFVQVRYMIPVLPMVCVVAAAGTCGWHGGEPGNVT